MVNRLAEQFHVVKIEWCGDIVESLYSVDVHHIAWYISVKFLPCRKNRGKRLQK